MVLYGVIMMVPLAGVVAAKTLLWRRKRALATGACRIYNFKVLSDYVPPADAFLPKCQ